MEKTNKQLKQESENSEYEYLKLKSFTHLDMYKALGFASYMQWVLGNIKSHLPKIFYTIKIEESGDVGCELKEGLCLEAKLDQQ